VQLFFSPDKNGYYSIYAGEQSASRLFWFSNIGMFPFPVALSLCTHNFLLTGRIMGICFAHSMVFPLPLCRHVLKYILGREIRWHDLAFFDVTLFESLRQLVMASELGDDLTSYALTFEVCLTASCVEYIM
jgi:E3 ubiquitin-protein ligase EDD1